MDQRLLRILGDKPEDYPHALAEKYPRVFKQIMLLWDAPEIDAYFMDLIVDKRGGRAGFPQDVAAEIVHLSLIHAAHHDGNQKKDGWDVASGSFAHYASSATPAQSHAWQMPTAATQQAIQKMGGHCSLEGFLLAAESGNRALLSLFLDAQCSTEYRNEQGWTALMLAAFNGHDTTLELLIKQGADVYASDNGGNTALHWAAFAGHVNCAKRLIENRADSDTRSSVGCTPLLQASARRHLSVVMLLINHGANLNIVSREGNTALHKAAAAGYIEIIRPLLAHHADTTIRNLEGDTAVKLAIKNKHEMVVKLLLSAPQ